MSFPGPAEPEVGVVDAGLYGHLFPDRPDELADRFDDAVCAPDVPPEPTLDDEEDDR